MKMDESQLVAAIEAQEGSAETYGNLQEDRVDALDYYLGKPLGNEVDGRSQVIARQVWDTVEWLKPQVTDIFCSGEKVVSFSPMGPNDVKAADQESDYVNHVITQRNEWFEIFYSWCHDALIQKNGYVKAYWDDSIDLSVERYKNLTEDEYQLLMQDKDIEITESEEVIEMVPMDEMGTVMPVVTHSCTLSRKVPRNVVKIENVAPEHVRVSQNARSLRLQDPRCNFVQHAEFKTISELRQDGFEVEDDIADGGDGVGDWEESLRDDFTPMRDRDGEESDPSMRRVKVRESWIRVDYDGDGLAELRRVIVVGTTVLLNEECDVCNLVALCPTPLPHQHVGLSVADAVMDLQKIQTALLRGALDNQYLANNGRYGVNEDNVNLDDMLDSRPGGLVRVKGAPGDNIFPLTHPTNGGQVVPMMEYVDKIAERRTGVSEQSMGLNPESMNNQAGAAANAAMLTAAQQRIRFIARVFAETGVKNLFQLVHMLTLKHSRKEELIELRGEWIPIDPRTWVKRNDLQVSLSLGSGDKAQQLMFLQTIAMAQEKALAIGVATPQNIYNTLSRMVKAGGYKDAGEFWTDPSKTPPKGPPPPDPRIVVEQMRQQSDVQRFQAEQQTAQVIETIKAQAKQHETELTLQLQAANDARDSEREQVMAQLKAQMEQVKIESDERIAALNDQTKRYVAELQANVDLQIAGMNVAQRAEQAASAAARPQEQFNG